VKKGLIIVAVAILVLYPAAAGLMGYLIEHRVDDALEQVGAQTPYVQIVDSHFHRGWFASEQDFTVQALQQLPMAGSLHISVHNVIHHGPICGLTCLGLARVDSHLVFSDEMRPRLLAIFGSEEPLTIRSRLGFFGGGATTVSSPAIKDTTVTGGDHASSDGLAFESTYGANADFYTAHGSFPHFKYVAADGKMFELTAAGVDINAKRALRSLYVGDTSVTVGRAAFGAVGSPGAFAANDLALQSKSGIASGFMTASLKYGSGTISTAPLTITGAHFDFAFRHLEVESLEALTKAMRAANQESSLAPTERASKMMASLKSPAIALLAQQPEIAIDRVSATTAGGSLLLTGTVKTHGVVAADFVDEASAKSLAQKVDADMDLTLDDGFLTSLPGGADSVAKLQAFVTQGLLTHEGGKFHTAIGFHQGQATFNGKPFGAPQPGQK
jgi:uncharacterized protein YdgA (DUF945 family)